MIPARRVSRAGGSGGNGRSIPIKCSRCNKQIKMARGPKSYYTWTTDTTYNVCPKCLKKGVKCRK